MIRLLAAMGLDKADENKNFILRQNHGQLLKRGSGGVDRRRGAFELDRLA